MTGSSLVLDRIGWIYVGVVIAWTSILASATCFLWYHRRLPLLHIRRLPLVFTALGLLHIYWTLCMIGYVIGPVAPCAAEYWIMSILVPAGIAIFQVANTQFLHIANQQMRYTSIDSLDDLFQGNKASALDGKSGSIWERTRQRLRSSDKITRMTICVSIGMVVQLVLTIFIFLVSRKFHPSFGILPANLFGTDAEVRMRCSRGWEWWLSIVWQFFWAWIYAPYILWRSRSIKDTHGWRLQTILCCIAGLPCSPLWLCGLYLPQFASINAVFIPPNWFSISIFLIESFTIFIPIYQIFRHQSLRNDTLKAISDWEAKNKAFGSLASQSTNVDSQTVLSYIIPNESEKHLVPTKSIDTSISSRKTHMYQMVALEHALRSNPVPLQKFAALKDFSGENISFLTHLANWNQQWARDMMQSRSAKPDYNEVDHTLRQHFNCALRVYAAFVSIEYAEFPINISSRALKKLDLIFSVPASRLYGDTCSAASSNNSATPFMEKPSTTKIDLETGVVARPASSASEATFNAESVWYWGEIPAEFGPNVFDNAEAEIKYLVLTNTWPRFVNAGYAEKMVDDEGRTLSRRLSQLLFRE